MKRVLVTGAGGFIGRHAVSWLARRGFEVHGVGRGRVSGLEGLHTWHESDLLASDPGKFLSTVQIGITSITLLNGIVGENAFAGPMARWLEQTVGVPSRWADFTGTAIVSGTGIVTVRTPSSSSTRRVL